MTSRDLLESLPAFFSVGAGGGVGFFVIKWFVEWIGGRVDKKEEAVERGFERLDAGTQQLISHLQSQMASVLERLDNAETALRDCQRKHAESEAEVARLKAIMQGSGEVREHVQRILAAEALVQKGADDGRS